MKTILRFTAALVAALALVGATTESAHAFRLIQNTTTGRTSFGTPVSCTDPGGFTHWLVPSISRQYSTIKPGRRPGVANTLRNAMNSWSTVPNGGHTLTLTGTTTAGFATDGANVIHWATNEGCTGGCLALTALTLQAGQVIVEADITFNDAFNWNTNGSDYDVEA